jgi:2-keto-4-pentenoate hydratase/2-oxohepta-3-ene-1,7-dioic acid hydratase in catechol pathway
MGIEARGILKGDDIQICTGDMFDNPQHAGTTVKLDQVDILPPCEPKNFLALWNNYYSRADKEGWDIPPEPLYFVKTTNSWCAHQQPIKRPAAYAGPVVFEAELGIVIGRRCRSVSEAEAKDYIFGYTCVNDVTAKEILNRDKSFQQWTRAKGFDSFGIFGPGIATGIEPDDLVIEAILDGETKQCYPVSDMVFRPYRLVSMISRDITLEPGDIIACGTALGACAMEAGQTIEVKIEGVGTLQNTMS